MGKVRCNIDEEMKGQLAFVHDGRGKLVLDWLLTADVAREMFEAGPVESWRWRNIDFAVPNELLHCDQLNPGPIVDWTKQEREETGDNAVAKILVLFDPRQREHGAPGFAEVQANPVVAEGGGGEREEVGTCTSMF